MRASYLFGIVAAMVLAANVSATPLDLWSDGDWTMVADDDGVSSNGFVDPGWGGQNFDAEYLFYRLDDNILSLGIQAGYNLETGRVYQSGRSYYAGDLALGINGGGYDYAIDFGLRTKDYDGDNVDADNNGDGIDAAGLYSVSEWNNDIYFPQSAPFAMDAGTYLSGLLSNEAGYSSTLDSYFRTVSIDMNTLGVSGPFDLSMNWTMSCGNDVLTADVSVVPVPEPGTLALLMLGLTGLALGRKRIMR